MKFSESLAQSPIPSRVGDVRLRYEPALLVGETRRRRGALPGFSLAVGAACGLGAVLDLLLPSEAAIPGMAAVLATSAALLVGLGIALDARQRAVRRFVLNFATESLRLERPARARGRSRLWVVHFDAVREVEVVSRPNGRFALRVEYAPAPGSGEVRAEVLVDHVPPDEIDTLRRLWRLLRGAFGLKTPQEPPAPA